MHVPPHVFPIFLAKYQEMISDWRLLPKFVQQHKCARPEAMHRLQLQTHSHRTVSMMCACVSATCTHQQTAGAGPHLNIKSGRLIRSGTRWCNVLLMGSWNVILWQRCFMEHVEPCRKSVSPSQKGKQLQEILTYPLDGRDEVMKHICDRIYNWDVWSL